MDGSRLLQTLHERVVIADGATGTQLHARGVARQACLDEINLTQPELVLAVHYEYRAAGSEAITTNTFGANRLVLRRAGLEDRTEEIVAAGAALARQVMGTRGFVLGSIGPVGRGLRAGDPTDAAELGAAFAEQAAGLAAGGVDAIVLETFVSMDELEIAVHSARAATDLPLIAQFSLPDRLVADDSDDLLRRLLHMRELGADMLGGNCGFGPLHLMRTIERLAALTDAPLSAAPNASFPQVLEGRYVFSDEIDYFVDAAVELADCGVTLLGGCCGTTPDHVRRIKERLGGRTAAPREITGHLAPPLPPPVTIRSTQPPVPRVLEPLGREPVIVVELDPPRGMDYEQVLAGAQTLAAAGVHGISIAENPLASIRMSSIALSHLVQLTAQIPAVCHVTCRDRNLLGQQSALMGASALGVNTILALTGDPINLAGLGEASAVFDTNSFGLLQMLRDFNEGRNALGRSLDRRTAFEIGVAFDPNARRIEAAVRRLEKKVAIGCDFAMTQMIYDLARIGEMYEVTAHLELPILAGFMPLVSARNARFLHNEVPGMRIPQEIQDRFEAVDGDREASQALGIELACEQVDAALAAGAPGIYLVTPFGRVEMMLAIVQHLKARVAAGAWHPAGAWGTAT